MHDRSEVRRSINRHSSDTELLAELGEARRSPGSIRDLKGTKFLFDSSVFGLENLSSLIKQISFEETDGFPEVTLEDTFVFRDSPMEVEEAFMTFLDVEVEGGTAKITGENGELVLSIECPSQSVFSVETPYKECRDNSREGILKRITFKSTPVDGILKTKVKMSYRER